MESYKCIWQNSILRNKCDKVFFRRLRSLSPERSEGDNRICHDKKFMHECRMRFYSTSWQECALDECDKCALKSRRAIKVNYYVCYSLHGENENTRGETHSTSWRRKMHIHLLQSKNWSVLHQYFAATEKVIFICLRFEIYPRQINIYLVSGFTLTLDTSIYFQHFT